MAPQLPYPLDDTRGDSIQVFEYNWSSGRSPLSVHNRVRVLGGVITDQHQSLLASSGPCTSHVPSAPPRCGCDRLLKYSLHTGEEANPPN